MSDSIKCITKLFYHSRELETRISTVYVLCSLSTVRKIGNFKNFGNLGMASEFF